MRKFIAKVQNSDEQTKKIWLVIFSAAAMAAVVGLWLLYLNLTLPTLSAAASTETSAEAPDGEAGFFSVFAAGVKIIYEKTREAVASKIGARNDILIEQQEENFQLENLDPIPATKLK